MTKTNTKHRTPIYRRPVIWVLLVIGILVIIALIIIFSHHEQPTTGSSPNSDQPATSQPQSDSTPDNQSSDLSNTTNEPDAKTIQYEGENPNDANDLTGVITYKGVDNDILYIAVTIDQYLNQNGTCELTLTGKNTSRTLTSSTPAIADIQSSVCQTFEIPTAGLPRDTYTIEIQLNSNDKTGVVRDEVNL